jgi:hypothetical protein
MPAVRGEQGGRHDKVGACEGDLLGYGCPLGPPEEPDRPGPDVLDKGEDVPCHIRRFI